METMQLVPVKSNHRDVMISQSLPYQDIIEITHTCDCNPSPFKR